jgi:hypothetical protein
MTVLLAFFRIMKIRATSTWEKEREETVAQYAERCLDGSDYESGQIEAIGRGNEKNSRAIGRLLELLATKGLLTAPEVTRVVESYENADAKFLG